MPNRRPPRSWHHRPDGLTMHELGIRMLMASDVRIQRYGFSRAVADLARRLGCEDDCLVGRSFLPDAYRIDEENCWIDLFEVEDTHPVTAGKLRKIAEWWEAWDGEGNHEFEPRLFTANRYGEIIAEVDLRAAFHAF